MTFAASKASGAQSADVLNLPVREHNKCPNRLVMCYGLGSLTGPLACRILVLRRLRNSRLAIAIVTLIHSAVSVSSSSINDASFLKKHPIFRFGGRSDQSRKSSTHLGAQHSEAEKDGTEIGGSSCEEEDVDCKWSLSWIDNETANLLGPQMPWTQLSKEVQISFCTKSSNPCRIGMKGLVTLEIGLHVSTGRKIEL